MLKLMMKRIVPLVMLVVATGFCGCDRSKSQTGTPSTDAGSPDAKALAALVLSAEPAGAKAIGEVKGTAKDGDEVVIVGRVGGTKDPFVAGRAIMTVADMKLVPCGEKTGDSCPTPWDYCCEPPDNLLAHTLAVQVVDATGKPLKGDLRGLAGIKPLSEVTIKGKISMSPVAKTLVLNAAGIHVKKP